MSVTNVSWQQVKELLHQAMLMDPEQRIRFLDQACSSNDVLRAEVENLLAAGEEVRASFLQSTPQAGEPDPYGIGGSLEPGQTFAERFQILRKLGEGGMGQVWLADQVFPVRRQVALKLIKAGMYDQAVVQRFQSERQAMAIMDHPAIAKVFDAGTTTQGQPYFVMEYVPGLPITEYCDQKKLTISQRLELFIQACEGVQHAHQKALIHRDLKPANILVIEVDGKPVPRVIDFGLVKASTPLVAGDNALTQCGHFMGTPGYISPEQADPGIEDIDTRSDVYSLGVVLYVLLAGSQPIDTSRWMQQPLDELLRRLREEEPPPPSIRVHSDRSTSAAIAEARGTEPSHLSGLLRGDLDWITMKALEKDRRRRYGTPSELAADLRRFLHHEPVLARPASAGYRMGKYLRRHRVAVGVAAGLVLLLAAFLVVQGVQLRRITRERDRANRERDRASRITDFMTGMFRVPDPNNARGSSVTAREILDKAAKDLSTGLAKDPEVQSQMMQIMGDTYSNLGLYSRAHELAQSALDASLRLHGPNDAETLESMAKFGFVLFREGRYPEAEKLERQALAGERRNQSADQEPSIEASNYLAYILTKEGHYDDAEKLLRETVDVGTRRLGAENKYVDMTHSILGINLLNQARYAEAEQEFAKVVDYSRRTWGSDDPRTLTSTANLALTLQKQGRLPQAESLYREVLAAQQRVYGPGNVSTAFTMENLASLLVQEDRPAEAEKLSREALAIRMRSDGPDHPDTFVSMFNLGIELFYEGKIREAEKAQRDALASKICVTAPEGPKCPVGRT